jgi:hypothetical protein
MQQKNGRSRAKFSRPGGKTQPVSPLQAGPETLCTHFASSRLAIDKKMFGITKETEGSRGIVGWEQACYPISTTTKECAMSETDVLANQKSILDNQKVILANQTTIENNQKEIKSNQDKLDAVLANQLEIKANQETIIANQEKLLAK